MTTFRAIAASEPGPATLQELTDADLPDGDVTIAVAYSSLNYKDGLAVTGKGKIMRTLPDGAPASTWPARSRRPTRRTGSRGDEVLVTGWGLSRDRLGRLHPAPAGHREWLDRAARRPDACDRRWRSAPPASRRCCASWRSRATGSTPARRRGARHRRGRRRRQRGGRRAGQPRLRGRRVDRPRRDARLPAVARGDDDRRPRRAGRPPAARSTRSGGPAAVDTVGSQTLADRARPDPLPRRRGRLRPGRWQRPADHGAAVHPAQRRPARRRLGDRARRPCATRRGVGSAPTCRPTCSTR